MHTRVLGRSGLRVGAVGLGCMEIGGRMLDDERHGLAAGAGPAVFALGDVDDDASVRAVRAALDLGVTLVDTAPAYGAGHSERVLGRALAGRRDAVVLATKFGKPIDEAAGRFGRYATPGDLVAAIRTECEGSLRRLRTDRIDLYQYHQMDHALLDQADDVVAVLEDLVAEGKVAWFGWSTDDPECARRFGAAPGCVAIQHHLSVVHPAPAMLAVCGELGLASIARGALGMGFLTGRYTAQSYRELLGPDDFRRRVADELVAHLDRLTLVRDVLTEGGRTLAQGALAWVLARSPGAVALAGFRTVDQARENATAGALGPLTPDQLARVEVALGRAA